MKWKHRQSRMWECIIIVCLETVSRGLNCLCPLGTSFISASETAPHGDFLPYVRSQIRFQSKPDSAFSRPPPRALNHAFGLKTDLRPTQQQ